MTNVIVDEAREPWAGCKCNLAKSVGARCYPQCDPRFAETLAVMNEAHAALSELHWIPCAKRNPPERGSYLTLSFAHGMKTLPEWKILNYGTSRKWDNGRNKHLPPESRVRFWMPLPAPPKPPGETPCQS